MMYDTELLNIHNLNIVFDTQRGSIPIIRGVSLSLQKKEILALVGESGSGKSVTAHSIMKLNPSPMSRVTSGSIMLCGHDIINSSEKEMQAVRGVLAGMVFQEHMTSLNPTMTIGKQLTEGLFRRGSLKSKDRAAKAVDILESVQITEAERRIHQYPHEFSGGMAQRVMIAMALAEDPKLLIADEPTTALDTTTQAQILKLIEKIRNEQGTAILLITHDLGVVANIADRVAVMYAGKIVESGTVSDIFHSSAHPYTQALLHSIPLYFQRNKQKLQSISGSPPDLYNMHVGCAFAPRCSCSMDICMAKEPPDFLLTSGHSAACFRLSPI